MKFKDLKYKGDNSEFNGNCLAHLKPETVILNGKKVYLQFSVHTWTSKRISDKPDTNVDYIEKHFSTEYIDGELIKTKKEVVDKRSFNSERYNKSLNLKDIIKALKPNDKLLQFNRDWFIIKNDLYHIFINIKPSKNKRFDYYIIITSAHYRDIPESGNPQSLKYILK